MASSIPSLLADRLNVSDEDARALLRTLVRELRTHAATDEVRLSGLGTFSEAPDGTLRFTPAPSLQRHVNASYEGLSSEPVGSLETPPTTAATKARTPDEDPSVPPPDAASASDADPAASGEAAAPNDAPDHASPKRVSPGPDASERRSPVRAVWGAALAALLLAAAGWLMYSEPGLLGASSPPASSTVSSTPPSDTASDTTSGSESPSAAASDRSSSPRPASSSPTARASTAPNRWAIVVASHTARTAALETAQSYRVRFDTVKVVAGTVDGQTWYRVAVGRYGSEPQAEQALARSKGTLPTGAWTHRLR
jgi:hypothetical protein